jgi:hypothetical protein
VLVELGINAGLCGAVPKFGTTAWTAAGNRLRKRLERHVADTKAAERQRTVNTEREAQRAAYVEFTGGALRRAQQAGPREASDPRFQDVCSRKSLLENKFAEYDAATGEYPFAAKAQRVWLGLDRTEGPYKNPGKLPTLETTLRWIGRAHGPANRHLDADAYIHRLQGFRPKRPGQVGCTDGSTFDCDVPGSWGDVVSGKPRRWFALISDIGSGFSWGRSPNAGSEHQLWDSSFDSLVQESCCARGCVFEALLMDRTTALAEPLGSLSPGENINRKTNGPPLGILFLLQCGVHLILGTPRRKTGNAFAENRNLWLKDRGYGKMERRAGELEHRGKCPSKDTRGRRIRRRYFAGGEPEYQRFFRECLFEENNHPNFRDSGKSSAELLTAADAQQTRLVPDSWSKFLGMLKYVRVGIVAQGDLVCTAGGGDPIGKLNAPVADDDSGAVMLILPGGLLESDTPGMLRCWAIRQRQGLTALTLYTGQAAERDAMGFSTLKPLFGEHRAKIENEEERKRNAAQVAAERYVESLPPQEVAPAAVRPPKPKPASPATGDAAKDDPLSAFGLVVGA